jgi:type II secretory pathway component PulC
MKAIIFFFLFLFSSFSSFGQKVKSIPQNPFLTTEEEMREKGIKPIRKKKKVELSGLKLTGIFYSPEKKIAIINSEFYTEGDEIGNFKIEKIEHERIILSDGRREEELRLRNVLAPEEEKEKKKEEKGVEKKEQEK